MDTELVGLGQRQQINGLIEGHWERIISYHAFASVKPNSHGVPWDMVSNGIQLVVVKLVYMLISF